MGKRKGRECSMIIIINAHMKEHSSTTLGMDTEPLNAFSQRNDTCPLKKDWKSTMQDRRK